MYLLYYGTSLIVEVFEFPPCHGKGCVGLVQARMKLSVCIFQIRANYIRFRSVKKTVKNITIFFHGFSFKQRFMTYTLGDTYNLYLEPLI